MSHIRQNSRHLVVLQRFFCFILTYSSNMTEKCISEEKANTGSNFHASESKRHDNEQTTRVQCYLAIQCVCVYNSKRKMIVWNWFVHVSSHNYTVIRSRNLCSIYFSSCLSLQLGRQLLKTITIHRWQIKKQIFSFFSSFPSKLQLIFSNPSPYPHPPNFKTPNI